MKKFIIAVIVSMSLVFFAEAKNNEPKEHPGIEQLRASLKDPASLVVYKTNVTPFGVCGTYNAKNSYGGYVGARTFYVDNVKGLAPAEVTDEAIPRLLAPLGNPEQTSTFQPLEWYDARIAKYEAELADIEAKLAMPKKDLRKLKIKPFDLAMAKSRVNSSLSLEKLLRLQSKGLRETHPNAIACITQMK